MPVPMRGAPIGAALEYNGYLGRKKLKMVGKGGKGAKIEIDLPSMTQIDTN